MANLVIMIDNKGQVLEVASDTPVTVLTVTIEPAGESNFQLGESPVYLQDHQVLINEDSVAACRQMIPEDLRNVEAEQQEAAVPASTMTGPRVPQAILMNYHQLLMSVKEQLAPLVSALFKLESDYYLPYLKPDQEAPIKKWENLLKDIGLAIEASEPYYTPNQTGRIPIEYFSPVAVNRMLSMTVQYTKSGAVLIPLLAKINTVLKNLTQLGNIQAKHIQETCLQFFMDKMTSGIQRVADGQFLSDNKLLPLITDKAAELSDLLIQTLGYEFNQACDVISTDEDKKTPVDAEASLSKYSMSIYAQIAILQNVYSVASRYFTTRNGEDVFSVDMSEKYEDVVAELQSLKTDYEALNQLYTQCREASAFSADMGRTAQHILDRVSLLEGDIQIRNPQDPDHPLLSIRIVDEDLSNLDLDASQSVYVFRNVITGRKITGPVRLQERLNGYSCEYFWVTPTQEWRVCSGDVVILYDQHQ